MKIKLNILPDEQKEKRKSEKQIGAIMRFGFSLIFVLLLLSVVIFSAQLVLNVDYKSIKSSLGKNSTKEDKEMTQAEKLLSEVNLAVQKVNKASSETPRWSRVLKRLSEIAPPELRINLIHIEKEHVKITGFSKTREAFLSFQDKLEGNGFKNVSSPISNLVSPTDLNFTIEVDMDKNYLNQL